ncbi:DM-kinase [Intoshia linei]|uniref:non-specific serine/threonine protein kinase n=1 Tax=Intoshia linei TaxID=1819745 RepID=A0A177BB60_9BILA|nr:DM-kinase [Intoshia linei]
MPSSTIEDSKSLTTTDERINDLIDNLLDPNGDYNVNMLLDMIECVTRDCTYLTVKQNRNVAIFVDKFEKWAHYVQFIRPKLSDFMKLIVIGRGAYGEVRLIRHKETKKIYAMKIMRKYDAIRRPDASSFWAERNVMVKSKSEWIVEADYTFQDVRYLYIVMEYMPGGDIVKLMNEVEFTEDMVRFYIAELILAIDVVHQLGYVHRDIKPDNILISRNGHIKLTDFGTCARMDTDGFVKNSTAVGTPDYISPEVLACLSDNNSTYGIEADFWSVGITTYEFVYDDTPFYDESLSKTYARIQNHEKYLTFPDDYEISTNLKNFISSLITTREKRLGRDGSSQLKAHPFFINDKWTWNNIRQAKPPFIPNLNSDDDTSNINLASLADDASSKETFPTPKTFAAYHLPFVGFTYNKLINLKKSKEDESTNIHSSVQVRKIKSLEEQLKTEKLLNQTMVRQVRQLEDGMKRVKNDEADLKSFRQKSQEKMETLRSNLRDVTSKLKYLEDEKTEMFLKLTNKSMMFDVEKQKRQELLMEAQDYKNKLKTAQSKLDEVEGRFIAENELYTKTKRLYVELQGVYDKLKEEYTEIQAKLEGTILSLEKYKNVSTPGSGLSEDRLKKMQDQLKESLKNEKNLKNNILQLKDTVEIVEMEKKNLEKLVNEIERDTARKSKICDLSENDEISMLKVEVSELESNSVYLKRKISEYEIKLEEALNSNKRQNDEMESLLESKNASEELIKTLEKRVSLANVQEINETASILVKNLKSDLSSKKKEIFKYQSSNNELSDQLDSYSCFMSLYKIQIKDLKNEIEYKSNQINKVQLNLSESQEVVQELKQEKNMNMVKLDQECSARKAADLALCNVELEKKQLEEHLNISKKRYEDEIEAKECTITKLEDQYNLASKKVDSVHVNRDYLKDQLDLKLSDIERLTKLNETLDRDAIYFNEQREMERQSKLQAIAKLSEVMSQIVGKHGNKVPAEKLKRKERELQHIQQEFNQEKKKYEEQFDYLQSEISRVTSSLVDEQNAHTQTQLKLEKLKKEVHVYRKSGILLDSSKSSKSNDMWDEATTITRDLDTTNSSNLGSMHEIHISTTDERDIICEWLSIRLLDLNDRKKKKMKKKGINWQSFYTIMNSKNIMIYQEEFSPDSINAPPVCTIDLSFVYHIRSVNESDYYRVPKDDISKIFQILYDSRGERIANTDFKFSSQTPSPSSSKSARVVRNHNLVELDYRLLTSCDYCQSTHFTTLISGGAAYECTNCKSKFHKSHLQKEKIPRCAATITNTDTARELILMATGESKKQRWIESISKRVALIRVSDMTNLKHNSVIMPSLAGSTDSLNSLRISSSKYGSTNNINRTESMYSRGKESANDTLNRKK